MSLGNIGQNSAQEFFETILYMTAYSEAQETINDLTKNFDNEVIKEAIQSAMTVLAFGVVFKLIQLEENYLSRVFNFIRPIVGGYLAKANGLIRKGMGSLGGKIGNNRLGRFLRSMSANTTAEADIATARAIIEWTDSSIVNTHQAASKSYDKINLINGGQQTLLQKEQFHLSNAEAQAKAYQQTLMWKLFSKNFTERDRALLRKMNGGKSVEIDELNKIADFMFVTDDSGNVTGLTQSMLDMLNALGYINKVQ